MLGPMPSSQPQFSLMEQVRVHVEGMDDCQGYVIEVAFDAEKGFWTYGISVEDGRGGDYEVWFPESNVTSIK